MTASCGFVWVDLAAQALENRVALFRIIRDYIEYLMEDKGLTRLMAAVEEDFPEAIRLAEHLGVKRESRMENWTGELAAFMYVRLGGVR